MHHRHPSPAAAGAKSPGQAALTPLLDTLFLLLFAVLAQSDGAEAREDVPEEIQVELPSVDGGASIDQGAQPLASPVVTIDGEGTVRLDGEAGIVPSSQALIEALGTADGPRSVEIRAHGDARHAVVVEVLHGLRQAGWLDVRFVAIQRDEGAASAAWGSR